VLRIQPAHKLQAAALIQIKQVRFGSIGLFATG
jgi:hypothetical protein